MQQKPNVLFIPPSVSQTDGGRSLFLQHIHVFQYKQQRVMDLWSTVYFLHKIRFSLTQIGE